MAEREFEFGKVIPASEAEQEYIFDPEIRELLASGDAIQGFPTSMVSERVGLPTALARGAADLFDTSRREVVMPAARELGDAIEAYNPETFGFDERIEERLRPGVFMRPEEATSGPEARANMPLARGVSQAVDFAGDLIRSPETRAQAIETLRTVPETLAEQTKLSGIASLRGERVIDPETGMTGMPYDAFLSATTPLAVGRAVSDVPKASFGIFGSGGGKSGKRAEDTVAMLEESGLDPSEGWERQDGANTYKAYRSSLDGKVRYEIPTANVAFRGVFRETEDPDVELGKLLDPETRDEQRLLAMQGLRIRKNKYNDKDYIHVPGMLDLDEKQLNKYGFTKLDSRVGMDGLAKFPAPVLEQIVDFPELFDEYPQLRSIQIKPTPALALFVRGSYNPDTKEISLASVPNTAEGRKEMMSTLLHEVQHAVQDIEGLYGGANTRMFEPAGFGERTRKNRDKLRGLETDIEDSLDNLVVTLDDPASKKPKTGMFSKVFRLSQPILPPRTQKGLTGAAEERVRFVKRATVSYLKQRAEEEEQLAAGELTTAEKDRRKLEDDIAERQQFLRDIGKSEKEIAEAETEYRGQAFRYGGSDREMIYLADELKKAGVKNPEKVAERIGDAFDEQIQKLRPLLKEQGQIDEINSRSYEMYEGNPGEVEARNVQRRFEGIEEGEYLRAPSGQLRPFPDKVPPVEMQNLDPEITQGMVLPEGGLVYSLAEGRKGQPSFSMDPPSNGDLEAKKAKLQQQRGIYDNRNSQLFENTGTPLKQSTVDRLKAERAKAGREMTRLQHEIDLEENEPNLPDSVITRDSSGQLLPRNDFYQANEYAFHGTRGAADRIIEDGGVHMNTDEPAFFMTESPAEAMTYGAGGLGDLGTVIPMRIDTRGFAEIDYGGKRYGELDDGGVVSVSFPSKETFFGLRGRDFQFEVKAGGAGQIDPDTYKFVDDDDAITISVDGSSPRPVSPSLLSEYDPYGMPANDLDGTLLNAVKDAGAPGARLVSFQDLNPTGAMMLRRTTKLNIPEENEILTVFDKSRQRLAKGNPAKADDLRQIGIARNPLEGFSNGGMVNNMRRRNISGLTNLFSKYNTSGPLAGAGVPRGTSPVEMRRGGRASSPREEAYRTDAPSRRDGIIARPNRVVIPSPAPTPPAIEPPPTLREEVLRTEPTTLSASDLNISDGRADELGAFDDPTPDPVPLPPVVQDPVPLPPVVQDPVPLPPVVQDPVPLPPVVQDPVPLPPVVQDPVPLPPVVQDPLPPPPPPPVMDLPPPPPPVIDLPPLPPPVMETPAPPPVIETLPPVVEPDPLPLPPVEPDPVPLPPVDVVQPPIEIPLPPIEETPLPPPVYTPPPPTEVVVPEEPLFTPPPIAETPQLPDPVMLSGETVDFDIADQITPQTGGYATTQGMNIAPTGDPFADAVEGEYQMPIYRPIVAAGAMPFLSLDFARPRTPSDAPPPPQSENYSTGSYGRLEFAEALANYERMYGPVEDYQAPDTDAVMTDDTTQSTETGTDASTVTSGTRFYPEPPPVRGSGGIGPATLYRRQLEAWEAQYGPVEDYYAAQNAAQQNAMNIYLSQQGEEAIAARYGYTVEQLREINARRRQQGLGPLGEIASGINIGM